MLQSPRLTLAIDALLRVYDHVLLDAGAASDLPAELLTSQARAVVVPDASMPPDARDLMCDQLRAVGFSEVTMLSEPCSRTTRRAGPRSWRLNDSQVGSARAHHPACAAIDGEHRSRLATLRSPIQLKRAAQLLRHLEAAPDCASPAAWRG